jgi:hypothetical protein
MSSRPESEVFEGELSFYTKKDYRNKDRPVYNILLIGQKYIKGRKGLTRTVTDSASERTASSKSAVISRKEYTAGLKRRTYYV